MNSILVPVRYISESLRDEREKIKWSQRELAKQSGVGLTTISNYELGRANPTIDTLRLLYNSMGYHLRLSLVKALDEDEEDDVDDLS